MPSIKLTADGKVLLKDGKVSCQCCDVGFILVCDPTAAGYVPWAGEGTCHTSPSWCIVTDRNGVELYNGCPELNFVQSSISAGTSIRVRYSTTEGPCAGGHSCNSATFKLYIKDSDSQVFLGNVNLNNGSGGGSVDGGTFTVTQEHLNALNLP